MSKPPTFGHAARSSRSRSQSGGSGLTVLWVVLGLLGSGACLVVLTCGLIFSLVVVGVRKAAVEVQRGVKELNEEIARQDQLRKDRFNNDPPNEPNRPRPEFRDFPYQAPLKDLPAFVAQNLKPNNQTGALSSKAPLWNTIRLGATRYANGKVIGGIGEGNFRDTAPDNGILIGFFVSAPDNQMVHFVQPIYLTGAGEKAGKAYGKPTDHVVCVKAKSGYAVGALDVRFGAGFDAMSVTFMRVQGNGLNTADSYQSMQMGGDGGNPDRLGGDGALIVGIHGQLSSGGFTPAGSIARLGLVTWK